jgi:hypothetical protein
MTRRCVFCGGGPLTHEHVIPRWLTDDLPEQVAWRGQDQMIVMTPPRGDRSRLHLPHREAPEAFNALTAKVVCKTCNNGWMNDAIEGTARPTLAALVRGEHRALEPADVHAVAAWAVKTSLIAQLTGTATAAALDRVYHDFYRERRPPVNAVVWAAAVAGDDWKLRCEVLSVLYAEDGDGLTIDDPPNTTALKLWVI